MEHLDVACCMICSNQATTKLLVRGFLSERGAQAATLGRFVVVQGHSVAGVQVVAF
jgi:hypothetical protein